jgi:tetratricopeptide (TPR) repeat protein
MPVLIEGLHPSRVDCGGATMAYGTNHPQRGKDSQEKDAIYYENLESRLRTIKDEIDALQIQIARNQQPWYKQVFNITTTAIAVMALVVAFGTTFISVQHTNQQDIQQDRSELRELTGRVGELERTKVEFTQTHSGNQDAINSFEAEIDTELLATALQAADIIERIPQYVSAAESTVIADQLADFDLNDRSISLLEIGIDRAKDAHSLTLALRRYAEVLFATGDFSEGRKRYEQASRAYERFPSKDQDWARYKSSLNELIWADSEIAYGNCEEAEKRVKRAVELSQGVQDQGLTDDLTTFTNDTKASLKECSTA